MHRTARDRIVAIEILKLELRLARQRAERKLLVQTMPKDAGRR